MVDVETTTYVDIELPSELPEQERRWVSAVREIAFQTPPERIAVNAKENGRFLSPVFLHIAYEALSFEYDKNPEIFADNYEHLWLPVYKDEGVLSGPQSKFGIVMEAFKAAGYPLTKNEVFRPQLLNTIWECGTEHRKFEREGEDPIEYSVVVPRAQLASYTPPDNRRVVKIGYQRASGVAEDAVTAEQLAAVKRILNGKAENDYFNALYDSGNELVMQDPFLREAGDPALLTARMVKAGGRKLDGKLYFAELE